MGFRFRKSINFGIFRVNASKTGLGWSVGVPGARYTQMANGRKRVTASIPGTGISWVEESKKDKKQCVPAVNIAPEPKKEFDWDKFWTTVGKVLEVLFWVALGVFAVIGMILMAADKKRW